MVAADPIVTERLLSFRVGCGRFAVRMENVLGVRGAAEIVAGKDGEAECGGRLVATFDARMSGWGGGQHPATAPPAVIIVGVDGGGAARMVVDRVEGIIENVEVRPLPALVEPFVRGVVCGVALQAEGLRLVIDPAALFAAGEKKARIGQRGPRES